MVSGHVIRHLILCNLFGSEVNLRKLTPSTFILLMSIKHPTLKMGTVGSFIVNIAWDKEQYSSGLFKIGRKTQKMESHSLCLLLSSCQATTQFSRGRNALNILNVCQRHRQTKEAQEQSTLDSTVKAERVLLSQQTSNYTRDWNISAAVWSLQIDIIFLYRKKWMSSDLL